MNDLEELKSLLFGAEKQKLDTLNERVQRPETRAVDIADVLPEAVRLSHQRDGAFVAELRDPVTRCLKQSFQETPQEYADVLYPIIGPAIRKSIAHALKAFAQQINRTMEHSLSAKGLAWRLQAWRSGVPFSDFVMQQTLQYRIEQAYLISRGNGLLMAHVHHDASRIKDSDAVSAMFTAIQDFVKESFSPDRSGRLETADMGEFTLWAVHGPHALMVCVIRGVPPTALRTELSAILERIHFRYGDALRSYAGDTSTVSGVEKELDDCLKFQAQQHAGERSRKMSIPLLIAILIVVGLLGYFLYERWQNQQQLERLTAVVATFPGIYVGNIDYADDKFALYGLRDPLAISIHQIALEAGLEPQQVQSHFGPFRSLDPEILFLRARKELDPPSSVSLSVLDGRLVVIGHASQQWIDALRVTVSAGSLGMPVATDNLESTDLLQLEASAAEANGAEFHFTAGTTMIDDDVIRLQQFAVDLKALADDASRLGTEIGVSVVGFTDSSGTAEYNAALSMDRAAIVVDALLAAGVNAPKIAAQVASAAGPQEESATSLRRVSVMITLRGK